MRSGRSQFAAAVLLPADRFSQTEEITGWRLASLL
jgi:hypothetical protein